jgi:hypothetical protein
MEQWTPGSHEQQSGGVCACDVQFSRWVWCPISHRPLPFFPQPTRACATARLASTGSGYSVAIYILVCAIVSISATIFLPDYTNQDISQEEAYRAPEASRVLAEAPAGS